MNKLEIFFFDKLVGHLTQEADDLSFVYADEYLKREDACPISISLPLTNEKFSGSVVEAFFGGFLPEADIRDHLARKFGISEENDFSLLNKIGGDCAGAISVGKSETRLQRKLLKANDLEKFFKQIPSRPLMSFQEARRMSLAGAQHKLAVLCEDDEIYLPASNEISTHIIKPFIKEYPNSSHNEYFCLELARRLGFRVPNISFCSAGDLPYLLIDRYDRDGQTRLHQEDFTQALGISYKMKYESEGGCGYKECFNLVVEHCDEAARDKLRLLDLVIFNFMIGNNDAHAKNFSLLYRNKAKFIELAPCYDLLSTAIYRDLSPQMSMRLGKEYNYRRVRPSNWEQFAEAIEVNERYLKNKLKDLSQEILNAAEDLKQELTPDYDSFVYEEIIGVIKERSKYASY